MSSQKSRFLDLLTGIKSSPASVTSISSDGTSFIETSSASVHAPKFDAGLSPHYFSSHKIS